MKKNELTIDIEVNSKRMAKKLKAISIYAAALAEELETIDASVECEECGSVDVYEQTLLANEKVYSKRYSCRECQHGWEIGFGEGEGNERV